MMSEALVIAYKQTSPGKCTMIMVEDLPQVMVAVVYSAAADSVSVLVLVVNIALPLARLGFAPWARRRLRPHAVAWLAKSLRLAWQQGDGTKREILLAQIAEEPDALLMPVLLSEPDLLVMMLDPGRKPPSPGEKKGDVALSALMDEGKGANFIFIAASMVKLMLDCPPGGQNDGAATDYVPLHDATRHQLWALAGVNMPEAPELRWGRAAFGLKEGASRLEGAPLLKGLGGALLLSKVMQSSLGVKPSHLGEQGGQVHVEAPKVNYANKFLTAIDLSEPEFGDAGTVVLAQALASNETITELDLRSNRIGDAGAKELAKALAANRSLTELYLRSNRIGDAGAKELAKALAANESLTKLDLRDNRIGDEGAKELAKALASNESLAELDLHDNRIGDAGAKELAKALASNESLTKLRLSYNWTADKGDNRIGDEGAKELAKALAANRSLTKLDLRHNWIGDEGAKELARALAFNESLAELDLGIHSIGDEAKAALRKVLRARPGLKIEGLTWDTPWETPWEILASRPREVQFSDFDPEL